MDYRYIIRIHIDGINSIDKVFDDENEAIEWFNFAQRCIYNKTTINVDARHCINSKYVICIEIIQKAVYKGWVVR